MTVRVCTATGMRAREDQAFAAGASLYEVMRAAGEGTAAVILARYPDVRTQGAIVFVGTGNNGGDGWVIAGVLAHEGCPVQVESLGEPTSADAQRAKGAASVALERAAERGAVTAPAVVVDALLGIGAKGEPRGAVADAITRIDALRAKGARIVAVDMPSGLDATTGAGGRVVHADCTVTFDAMKQGLLLRRDETGALVVLDIGLPPLADENAARTLGPELIDAAWVRAAVPPIPAAAHKGVRRRITIVGGGEGMAGAPMLAARGALRSGIGMVRLLVAPTNVPVVQGALPEAMAARWPMTEEEQVPVLEWSHALLLGPGLGRGTKSRALIERLLVTWRGPVVLDADALNVFEGEPRTLGSLLGARPAIVTPHPVEAARLMRLDPAAILANRFIVGAELARTLGAVVLLKGPPTVISAPDGRVAVVAAGGPALGTGGSGDVLSGIVATLLAQLGDPFVAAAAGAWVHGRAGELAAGIDVPGRDRRAMRSVRGTNLTDVIDALPKVWRLDDAAPLAPILAQLPKVGGER
ncbi:MAG: NAD(P)H-hydrate dehydratase [Gemmatimonadetes bacterium]|nr:NAD(P)H-hydrate dehydratase [Gemmatimonadota bacterium]